LIAWPEVGPTTLAQVSFDGSDGNERRNEERTEQASTIGLALSSWEKHEVPLKVRARESKIWLKFQLRLEMSAGRRMSQE